MKRALKFALFGFLIIVALLCVAIAWVINDEALIEQQIEKHASLAVGRAVDIEGVDLDLGRRTRVFLDEVHLDNSQWASAADLLYIDDLYVTLDLGGVLRGEVVIESLVLDGVMINLEKQEDGLPNWQIGPAEKTDDEGDTGGNVEWRELKITRLEVNHQSSERTRPLELDIGHLELDHTPDDKLIISAAGAIDQYPLSVEGFVYPLAAFTAGGSIDHRLDASLGEVVLTSSGVVDDIRTGAGARVDMQFSGPQIEWLLAQAALPEFSTGPFDVGIHLDVAGQDEVLLNVDGDFGTLYAQAQGEFDQLINPSRLDLEFDVTGPELDKLGAVFGVDDLPAEDYRVTGNTVLDDEGIHLQDVRAEIGEDRLAVSGTVGSWPKLSGTGLDIAVNGRNIRDWLMGFEDWQANDFAIEGRFFEQEGNVAFSGSRVRIGEARLEFNGTLGAMPGFVGGEVSFDLNSPDMRTILDLPTLRDFPAFPFSLEGRAQQAAGGVSLEEIGLVMEDNRLSLSGFLAIEPSIDEAESAPWPEMLAGSRVSITTEVPSIRDLGLVFELEDLPDEAMQLRFNAELLRDGLAFEIPQGKFGRIDWSAQGVLPGITHLDDASASFELAIPSLHALSVFAPELSWPDVPAQFGGSVQKTSDGLVIDTTQGTLDDIEFDASGNLALTPRFMVRQMAVNAAGAGVNALIDDARINALPQPFALAVDVVSDTGNQQIRSFLLQLGETKIEATGQVDDFSNPEAFSLDISLSVPDPTHFQDLIDQFGTFSLPAIPVSSGFTITGNPGHLKVDNLTLQIGEGGLSGWFELKQNEVPEIRAAFESEYLNLAWLPDPLESKVTTAEASAVPPPADKGRVLSDEHFGLLTIDPILVDVRVKADAIDLPNQKMVDVDIGLQYVEDELRISPLSLTEAAGGQLAGSISLKKVHDILQAEVQGNATGFRVGFAAAPGQDAATYPALDLRLDLVSAGASMHDLAVAAEGRVELVVGEGQIANSRMDLLFSDVLAELLSMLNPFRKDSPYTPLDCVVAVVEFSGGVATINPLISQTDKMIMTSNGTIQLQDESIDFGFNTRPRKGIGISPGVVINPFIKLGGTLADPAVALDKTGTAVTGGAAVASGGLTLLGKSLFDRYLRGTDPCGEFVADISDRD